MIADLMEYYEKMLSENPISNHVSIYCKVDHPDISYSVESFGEERGQEPQALQWDKAGGVDAYFDFKTAGVVEYPTEFEGARCDFLLNPLGSLDRFRLMEEGSIGEGWFKNGSFLFRLYLSLDASRGLIEQMKYSHTRLSISFDLFDVVRRKDWISYSICRLHSRQ